MSAQCRYQADTYIHAGWSTDLGVGPEVGGAVLNTYVAAATRGVRSLALISWDAQFKSIWHTCPP